MYLKIDEEKIKKIEKITMTDYECEGDYIPCESIINLIDDLLLEIERHEEEINDLKQDIENNYELKRTNPYEEYGVSEKDFY